MNSETGSVEDFASLLDQEGISHTLIQDKLKNFRTVGGRWETAHVVAVSGTEDLEGFLELTDISSGQAAAVPEDGVLISRRAAEELGLSAGSTIELMAGNGEAKEAVVSGVIEHYLACHLIVTSESYYEEVMGESSDPCVFLLQGDVSGLADKIRELAVMRVNSCTMGQTKAYVYKDNIMLILLGLVAGCLFGVGMAHIDIRVIEAGAEHYVRSPNLMACLLACAILAVFAVAVNIIALRKINRLSLTNVSSN